MIRGRTPDLTLAQVLAALAAAAVAVIRQRGWLDRATCDTLLQLAAVWIGGDAVIRHGRSRALRPPAEPPAEPVHRRPVGEPRGGAVR